MFNFPEMNKAERTGGWIPGMLKLLLRTRKVGFVMLGHGVTDSRTDDYIESQHVDFQWFKEVIRQYQELGFEFISATELLRLAQNGFKYNRNWIHLTFDDGYRNTYIHLYPYLKKKNIPFSLFISTNHIQKNERFYVYKICCVLLNVTREICIPGFGRCLPADASREDRIQLCEEVLKILRAFDKAEVINLVEYINGMFSPEEWQHYNDLYGEDELLTVEQVREMAQDNLVQVGSHNHNHVILNANVSEEDLVYEMGTSKAWLEANLNVTVFTYCYPSGSANDFTPLSKEICQRLGYKLAFTTVNQPVSPQTDRYAIPRVGFPVSRSDLERRLMKYLLPEYVVGLFRLLKSTWSFALSA